jgi:formamidopyrimidine-DNA glycosylase
MPELPDIEHYLHALRQRITGMRLDRITLNNPFLLRTAIPPVEEVVGREVTALRRLGKRIAIGLEGDYWLVVHLMIAGRLAWLEPGVKRPGRRALGLFDFASGTLVLTEAGSKRRASLHIVRGAVDLDALDPHGLEPLSASAAEFTQRLTLRNHTLKRALTDPRLFSGIGNAYSDEIPHHAKLSPIAQTQKLDAEEVARLYGAVQTVLADWMKRLREAAGDAFQKNVTAFRPGMSVHGRFGEPCPECGTEIQRIRYVQNELNYCPRCQTGGRVLADRSLSRVLKKDWPRTIEELEAAKNTN